MERSMERTRALCFLSLCVLLGGMGVVLMFKCSVMFRGFPRLIMGSAWFGCRKGLVAGHWGREMAGARG